MAIVRDIQEVQATVGLNDEYRVELHQVHPLTTYSPSDALTLANELAKAAGEARELSAEGGDPAHVVHAAPEEGTELMPCCGRSPWSLDGFERMSWRAQSVTCRPLTAHGFDVDGALHPECRDGKCRNCDGRTLNGRDEMVPCTHACHTEAVAS
ncbi:MAG: hypothetical protein K0S70_820 [Microbacterium sp.]|jgi:hypothetical protein|nr:hypothetical protein [Microbacterium sp.]